MAAAVVFLPLFASVIAGFFGRAIGDRGAQLITCGALLLSAVLGILLFRQILASGMTLTSPLARMSRKTKRPSTAESSSAPQVTN